MIDYSEAVLAHFRQPRHCGALPLRDNVHVGEAHSAAYRDHVKFYLQLDDAGVITASWQVLGAPATIACASLASEWLQGLNFAHIDTITVNKLTTALELTATQRYSAIIVLEAIQHASATDETL